MAKKFTSKRTSYALEIETFDSTDGKSKYLVIKTGNEYHVFAEVEAKEAATDCGCPLPHRGNTTQQIWNYLWNERKK
jgi:hypothetical protein